MLDLVLLGYYRVFIGSSSEQHGPAPIVNQSARSHAHFLFAARFDGLLLAPQSRRTRTKAALKKCGGGAGRK